MKTALQNISLILILSAVLESILPQSNGKRAFRLLCGVAIFTVLVSSVRQIDFQNLNFDDPETVFEQTSQDLSTKTDSALLLAANQGYAQAAADTLRSAGVPFRSVHAMCELNEEALALKKLIVIGVEPEGKETAANALLKICSIEKIEWSTEEPQ